jgi:hypothetical protein
LGYIAMMPILAGTWRDGLFVVDGGVCGRELANQPVRSLAPDGAGGALAIVGGKSLRRRTAPGLWSTVATADVELSCCMALGDAIYVGTDDARILRCGANAAFEPLQGLESVAGRDQWYAGTAIVDGRRVGPPLGIRSMTATCDGSALLANVHVGGIARSADRGATWVPTIDIHTDVHQVSAHPARPEWVIAAAGVGLCISENSGMSWSVEQDGLHALHCSAVAFAGDDILVSASEDPFAARGAVYRRPLGAGPLQLVAGGLPSWTDGIVDTGCIAARGSTVAVVDGAGRLYLSEDTGLTWSCPDVRIPDPSCVLVC